MILLDSESARPDGAYHHRQVGWPVVVASMCVLVIALTAGINANAMPAILIVGLVSAAVGLFIGSLTVTVDDSHVRLRFGVGVIRKNFALDTIRSCRIVRNPWYHGTGIRMISGGWLYTVGGRMAVELERTDSSVVRIGTDEPTELLAAIQQAAQLSDDGRESEPITHSGGYWPALVAASVMVAVAGMFYMSMRPPRVVVAAEALTVRGGFYKSVIPIGEITEVVVSDSLPEILARTNGFSFGSARRGHFRLESLGNGMLFLDRGYPPYVVVHTATTYVMISYKDYQHTSGLIEALAKISAS